MSSTKNTSLLRDTFVAIIGALIGGSFSVALLVWRAPDVQLTVGLPIDRGSDRIVMLKLVNRGGSAGENVQFILNSKLSPSSLNLQKAYSPYKLDSTDQRHLTFPLFGVNEDAQFYLEYPSSLGIEPKELIEKTISTNCVVRVLTNDVLISNYTWEKQERAFCLGMGTTSAAAAIAVFVGYSTGKKKKSGAGAEIPAA